LADGQVHGFRADDSGIVVDSGAGGLLVAPLQNDVTDVVRDMPSARADASGNSRTGTYLAGASGVHGGNLDLANGAGTDAGRAVVMNGSSSANAAESLNLPSFSASSASQFTIEMWIKPDSLASASGFQALYVTDAYAVNGDFHYNLRNGNELQFALRGNSESIINLTTAGAAAGIWNQLVSTYDASAAGGTIKMYVNGSLKSTQTGVGAVPFSIGSPAALGRWDGGVPSDSRYFQGAMDEFALYTSALTDSQVALHFASIPEPSIVALLGLGGLLLRRRTLA